MGASPGQREGAAVATLRSPQGLLLFGGVGPDGGLLGDTWQYQRDFGQWTGLGGPADPLCNSAAGFGDGACPAPRAYASAHQVALNVYLLGGMCQRSEAMAEGAPCGDFLWEFSRLSNKWTKPAVLGAAPAPRYAHASAVKGYSVYLYGGTTGGNRTEAGHPDGDAGLAHHVWELDLLTKRWTEHRPKGYVNAAGTLFEDLSAAVRPRFGHAGVLHQAEDGAVSLVFQGGIFDGYVRNDVLQFDLAAAVWKPFLFLDAPFRAFHGLHAVRYEGEGDMRGDHLLVIYGFGHDNQNFGTNYARTDSKGTDEIMSYPLQSLASGHQSVNWKRWRTTPATPSKRFSAAVAALDENTVMMIGGLSCGVVPAGTLPNATCHANTAELGELIWELDLREHRTGSVRADVRIVDGTGARAVVDAIHLYMNGNRMGQALGKDGLLLDGLPMGELAVHVIDGSVLLAETVVPRPDEDFRLNLTIPSRQAVYFQFYRSDGASYLSRAKVYFSVYNIFTGTWDTSILVKGTDSKGALRAMLFPSAASSSIGQGNGKKQLYRLAAFARGEVVAEQEFEVRRPVPARTRPYRTLNMSRASAFFGRVSGGDGGASGRSGDPENPPFPAAPAPPRALRPREGPTG